MLKDQIKISLRENGEHSFKRSLEFYKAYERTQDQMLLKDTIIFLHHGIELLLKEVLIRHSPYLIFEELRDIPKKQKDADTQGVGIFYLEKPPKSVSYDVAISRVEAFIKPEELNESLLKSLDQLNRLRNQLEHYAIEISREEVVKILEAIHKPILKLFESQIGPLTQLQTPEINQTWNNIEDLAEEQKRRKQEVYDLIKRFNWQRVPGYLFNVEDEVTLPKFDRIFEESFRIGDPEDGVVIGLDILAENYPGINNFPSTNNFPQGDSIRWVIEIKLRPPSTSSVYHVAGYRQLLSAIPWIVVFDRLPALTRERAKEQNVMLTGSDELKKLKSIIEQGSVTI